jgi:CheY-like chemotaxis protein
MADLGGKAEECFDTLRISAHEQMELLAELERHDAESSQHRERRTEDRILYRSLAGLIVRMRHPGGTTANYLVRTRNISNRGIGFLHGSFVYSGTSCTVVLRTLEGKAESVEGSVVRCHHLRGRIHDIGVRFAQPIRLRHFVVSIIPSTSNAEQSVELPRFRGRVLYVENSPSDQDLLKFYMDSLGVELHIASDGLEAMERADSTRFDLVITAIWLPAMSGTEVAASLRQSGYTGPIIALTADDRTETRAQAMDSGCTSILMKPYRLEELVQALGQHLPRTPLPNEQPALLSELWDKEPMRPLIRKFLDRLDGHMRQIQQAVTSSGPTHLLQKLCMDLKGSAGGFGYPQISGAAQKLLELAGKETDLEPLGTQVAALARLCHAARQAVPQPVDPTKHDDQLPPHAPKGH